MSQSNLKRIVNAFVISRIDYCNSILYGLPMIELEKLQRVQNIAARLITELSSRRDHITPVLKNLHWLPVRSRITFKILLLTYKILNGHSPRYLTSLISFYKPARSLRSSDHLVLQRVVQGGSVARFTNRKNNESRITDIKISFSRITEINK